jgi:hypothetical protein
MIDGLDGVGAAGRARAGEGADLNFRFGIDGNSQRVRVGRRRDPGGLDVVEDGVGLGDFFSGRALRTRRRR